jgi:GNAT superfamily N-acetyltransferase
MKIRPARPDEAPLIQELIYELAVYEKAPESAQASLEDISRAFFAEHPAVFCDFVEDESEQVVGLAIWFLNYSTWTGTHGIYLEDLFIRPESRGKGFGKAVLKHLAAICVARGYHRLQWWVLDWNSPAIDFYRSLGAIAMDEWTTMRMEGEALASLANLSQD